RVGIALAEGRHPGLHLGLADGAARLLAAPDEVVLFEDDVVLGGVVVDGVQRLPVERAAGRRLHRAPLAGVLGRDLVPVLREGLAVGVDLLVGGDVPDELDLLHPRRSGAAAPRRCARAAAAADAAAPPARAAAA